MILENLVIFYLWRMRKYQIFVSIITLILGFTFYGETVFFNIGDTYYVMAAESLCFAVWAIITIILTIISLKKYFSRDEA